MTLRLISANGFPAYTALSTDISGSTIEDAALIGKTIYTLDTQKWYIINSDGLLLEDFTIPNTTSGSLIYIEGGNVTITNFPETYSGSITNLPTEYPISGSVNVINFPEVQNVSGSVTAVISGSVTITPDARVCEENTTSTPLEADEVFLGAWQDMLNLGNASIGIISDKDSATDGLQIQWSTDGVDIDDMDVFTISANIGKTFTFGAARRYIRLQYTNGNEAQTSFNLQTVLRSTYVKPSSHRIQDSIVAEDDAELIKAVLTGYTPSGVFKNVNVTNGANLKMSLEELETGVSSNGNSQLNVTQYLSDGTEGTNVLNFPDTYSGSITNLPSEYPISGSVNVLNFPETQAISGSVNATIVNDVTTTVSGSAQVVLYDTSGCPIDTHNDAEGEPHLGVSFIQTIITSAGNSSTDNLNSGSIFTGTAEETFGINTIQTYLFADQDCTLFIEQGVDGTNWDVSDELDCLANVVKTRASMSVAPYFRIRVRNDGDSATTIFRVAAGMTPSLSILPRNLSDDDRLKTESTLSGRENTDRHVWVTPSNALKTADEVRLVGTNFDGTIKDPNFWTEVGTGSGSATQSGEIQLDTGTTADSSVQYNSVRRARFVVGSALQWQAVVKFVTEDTANNIRRFGAYDDDNGFFFELDGSTFSIGYRKSTVDTLVSSGSFNGNFGVIYDPNQTYHKYAIEWTPRGVFFYIDGTLLHKDGAGHRSNVLTLPIRLENYNYNGSTSEVSLDILATAILRLGSLITNPTYRYIGTNATTVLKYGAGTLQRITNLDNSGTVSVYDNTAASGTQIAVIDSAKALGTLEFNAPFSNGLTVVTALGAKITVIYE